MKKIILLFINFLSFIVFSQEIAIPYRDGTKWGICNDEGKITIEPRFDKLDFSTDYDATQDILIPKLDNKEGLIINGKILFEPIYESIYQNNNLFFTTKFENNTKLADVFDNEGKSILKKPVLQILSNKKVTDAIYIFHLLNDDYTETFYLYDIANKKIIQTLYENYYSINFIKEQSDYFSVSFLVKKRENDPLIAEAWDITKLPKEITKTKLLYRTENEYLEKFLKKAKKDRDNYYSEGRMGSGNGVGGYDIKGDPDGDIAIEAPREENNYVSKTVYIYHNFKMKDNKLVVSKNFQNQTKTLPDIQVDIKIPLKDIEIKNYSFNSKKNDTISYFSNFIQYKNKGKYGLIFPSDLKKTIEFDTIAKNLNSISDINSYNREVILLVGNKDKKTNQFKYSLYSNLKGLLFPMQYDNLIYQPKLYSYNGNSNYMSKIGNKYGIVQIDGTEFMKAEYDEINENQKYESDRTAKKVLELRKENKYGVVYQNISNYKIELIDAVFDYEIKSIFLNFPKVAYQKKKESDAVIPKKITLVSLKDKRGNLVGYANANGMLYYKN